MRKSGIENVEAVPWGTHISLFYQIKEDLVDVLVTYFKAGLENNEVCMWVVCESVSADEVRRAMRESMPDFDGMKKEGKWKLLYIQTGILTMVSSIFKQCLTRGLINLIRF